MHVVLFGEVMSDLGSWRRKCNVLSAQYKSDKVSVWGQLRLRLREEAKLHNVFLGDTI